MLVKWFVDEKGSRESLELRRRYIEGKIKVLVPSLMVFEFLNALRYKNLFTVEEVKKASETLEAYSFETHHLSGEYASQTVEIAYESDLTLYDAAYVALSDIEDSVLYTADSKLINKLNDRLKEHVKNIYQLKDDG